MSRVTDVLVTIDTETILKKYPGISKDPKNPTLIDWHHVYMVTNQDNVVSGQAGGEHGAAHLVAEFLKRRGEFMGQHLRDDFAADGAFRGAGKVGRNFEPAKAFEFFLPIIELRKNLGR